MRKKTSAHGELPDEEFEEQKGIIAGKGTEEKEKGGDRFASESAGKAESFGGSGWDRKKGHTRRPKEGKS